MKTWKLSALSLCLGLLAASAWVLVNPVPARAAEGSARCGGTKVVTCEAGATKCVCEDYKGCTSYFSNNTSKETKCSDSLGGPAMEEGDV